MGDEIDAEAIWDEIYANSHRYFRDPDIDIMVHINLTERQMIYVSEEHKYVERMLRENPLPLDDNGPSYSRVAAAAALQKRYQQKIDSYRLTFIKNRLEQGADMNACLWAIAQRAETRLLNTGYRSRDLHQLRLKIGVRGNDLASPPRLTKSSEERRLQRNMYYRDDFSI